MNKARNKIQEKLVSEIISSLEKGRIPWKKRQDETIIRQYNPITNNVYENNNQILLQLISATRGYSDPRWLTFDQASAAGYKIRKGSVSFPLEKWGAYDQLNKKDVPLSIISIPFNVFNAECVEGIPNVDIEETKFNNLFVSAGIDNIIKQMGVEIAEGPTERYEPSKDIIHMKERHNYQTDEDYYGTLLHLLVHATGHPSRLNRDLDPFRQGVGLIEGPLIHDLVHEFSSLLVGAELGVRHISMTSDQTGYHTAVAWYLNKKPETIFSCIKEATISAKYLLERFNIEEVEKTTEARKQKLIEEKINAIKAKQFNVSDMSASEIQALKIEIEAYHNGYLTVEEYQNMKNEKFNKNVKLEDIKSKIQITEYARSLGFNLVKQGDMHSLEEHDSCKIYKDNHFYRFSSKTGGSIIDFIKEFQEVDTPTAIKYAENYYTENNLDNSTAIRMNSSIKKLEIPSKVNTFNEVIGYLTINRKINKELVNKYIQEGILFQDDHANCVFVGKDAEQQNKAFYLRSTKSRWMGVSGGSDSKMGVFVKGDAKNKTLVIHEAVIDQMSYIQINDPRMEKNYLATQSVNNVEKAIDYHLKNRQNEINEVVLALDNDEAGREAIERATVFILENYSGIEVYYDLPLSKDFNEDLKSKNKTLEKGVDIECQQ